MNKRSRDTKYVNVIKRHNTCVSDKIIYKGENEVPDNCHYLSLASGLRDPASDLKSQ